MEPLAYHLVFRTVDGRVIAPGVAAQRTLASACHDIGERSGIVAFRASGDHLHLQAVCDRAEAGALARRVAGSLTRRLTLPGFAPAHLTPCRHQGHVEETFFYILRNTDKHGVTNDPMHEASSIGALLGMRTGCGPFLARARRLVPTMDRAMLLAVLGVRTLEESVHLAHLADAAAGAVGLAALDGSTVAAVARAAATRCAAHLATTGALEQALGISARSLRRYLAEPANPALERAIRLRIGLRIALGDRARVDLPVGAKPLWTPGKAALRRAADAVTEGR
jgi:hypothetical protein